jgi:hypothetical protein
MSADKSRPSHHRDQDAAISALAHVRALGARGHSPGVRTRIDGAFLAMSRAGQRGCATGDRQEVNMQPAGFRLLIPLAGPPRL